MHITSGQFVKSSYEGGVVPQQDCFLQLGFSLPHTVSAMLALPGSLCHRLCSATQWPWQSDTPRSFCCYC